MTKKNERSTQQTIGESTEMMEELFKWNEDNEKNAAENIPALELTISFPILYVRTIAKIEEQNTKNLPMKYIFCRSYAKYSAVLKDKFVTALIR